jgi:rhomboid protease GluP
MTNPADNNSTSNQSQTPRMLSIALPTYKPSATMVILGVTVLFYLIQVLSETSSNGTDLLFAYGGKINQLIEQGQIWRLLTPVFLHGSITHILLNMYALFILGRVVESAYGHWRFLLLYFLAAFAGNVASFVMSPNPSLGASTAIFGLIGAEAIFVIRNKRFYGNRFSSTLSNIGFIIVLNLAVGFMPGTSIDYWGHIGGLIGGILFAILAGPQWEVAGAYPEMRVSDKLKNSTIILSGIIVAIIFLSVSILLGGK